MENYWTPSVWNTYLYMRTLEACLSNQFVSVERGKKNEVNFATLIYMKRRCDCMKAIEHIGALRSAIYSTKHSLLLSACPKWKRAKKCTGKQFIILLLSDVSSNKIFQMTKNGWLWISTDASSSESNIENTDFVKSLWVSPSTSPYNTLINVQKNKIHRGYNWWMRNEYLRESMHHFSI